MIPYHCLMLILLAVAAKSDSVPQTLPVFIPKNIYEGKEVNYRRKEKIL